MITLEVASELASRWNELTTEDEAASAKWQAAVDASNELARVTAERCAPDEIARLKREKGGGDWFVLEVVSSVEQNGCRKSYCIGFDVATGQYNVGYRATRDPAREPEVASVLEGHYLAMFHAGVEASRVKRERRELLEATFGVKLRDLL